MAQLMRDHRLEIVLVRLNAGRITAHVPVPTAYDGDLTRHFGAAEHALRGAAIGGGPGRVEHKFRQCLVSGTDPRDAYPVGFEEPVDAGDGILHLGIFRTAEAAVACVTDIEEDIAAQKLAHGLICAPLFLCRACAGAVAA